MTTHIIYFDDVERDRLGYSRRLEATRLVEVSGHVPPVDLDLGQIGRYRPDLVLVDYELTQPTDEDTHVNYKGATLASALREVAPNYPIVLFTRRNLLGWDIRRLLDSLKVFDAVMDKGDVDADPHTTAERLVTIANGFNSLRGTPKTWSALVALLGVHGDREEDLLKDALPPVERGQWQVPEVSRWIQDVLLAYAGILDAPVHAATILGISGAAFQHELVQRLFAPARYDACFAPPEGRWWRNRVLDEAVKLGIAHNYRGSVNRFFAQAFKDSCGVDLEPACCSYSGQSPADAVCVVSGEQVMTKFSLAYHLDNRPPVMDEARISFKVVLEGNNYDADLLEPGAFDVVEEARRRGEPK